MRRYRNETLAAFCALILALSLLNSSAFGQAPRYSELPNFRKIDEHIYGGAQPQAKGLNKLAELGIKTIINLRGVDKQSQAEEKEAQALGLHYYSIPMPGLSRPSDDQVAKVFALLNDQNNWPVFIHCKHGSDRTGTILACYRISHDRWNDDKAITEAKQYGMSWMEFGMRSFVSDYYKRQVNAAAVQSAGAVKSEVTSK